MKSLYKCIMGDSYHGVIEFEPCLNEAKKEIVRRFFGEENLENIRFTDKGNKTILCLRDIYGNFNADSFVGLNHSIENSIQGITLYYTGEAFGKLLFRNGEFSQEDLVYLSEVSDEALEKELAIRKKLRKKK